MDVPLWLQPLVLADKLLLDHVVALLALMLELKKKVYVYNSRKLLYYYLFITLYMVYSVVLDRIILILSYIFFVTWFTHAC